MTKERVHRVAMAIKEAVSQIILHELKDPRIGFVTVTHVDLTGDLKIAHIYYSLMEDAARAEASKQGLAAAKGFIRKRLGETLKLRFTPEIHFRKDDSIAQSFHIAEILKNLEKGKRDHAE